MIVYAIRCSKTEKYYIGQTISTLDYRWKKHKQRARAGENTLLARAIRKHGERSFTVEILATCSTQRRLDALERRYIREYRSDKSEFGYNIMPGGRGHKGYRHTEETRRKMSVARRGHRWSEEVKRKISVAHLGRKFSAQWRRNISRASRVAWALRVDRSQSPEHRRKISEARKRYWERRRGR